MKDMALKMMDRCDQIQTLGGGEILGDVCMNYFDFQPNNFAGQFLEQRVEIKQNDCHLVDVKQAIFFCLFLQSDSVHILCVFGPRHQGRTWLLFLVSVSAL